MSSSALRILVPVLVFIGGIVVISAIFTNAGRGPGNEESPAAITETAPETAGQPADRTGEVGAESAAEAPGNDIVGLVQPENGADGENGDGASAAAANATGIGAAEADPRATTTPTAGGVTSEYRLLPRPQEPFAPLGQIEGEGASDFEQLRFSPFGAGIEQIVLRDHYETLDRAPENRYALLQGQPLTRPALGLQGLVINGQGVNAQARVNPETGELVADLWRQVGPGRFEALVVNAADEPVLLIERAYRLGDSEGEFVLEQSLTNYTASPLEVSLEQWGPGDLPHSPSDGYADYRRVKFGYLDPRSASTVLLEEGSLRETRRAILSRAWKADSRLWEAEFRGEMRPEARPNVALLWPNETSIEDSLRLAWIATTNRYFGFAVYPHLNNPEEAADKQFQNVQTVEFRLDARGNEVRLAAIPESEYAERYMTIKMTTPSLTIPPQSTRTVSLGGFAGPLSSSLLSDEQPYKAFNLDELILYELGCTWCTFQWLAHFLLWFLHLIYGDVVGIGVFDWAIAIIILVIIVRTLLHPLTKRGQISMQRFSKKMTALQPELKKLQEKYKDDPKKYQQEQMRLMREHQVNPAGCLGMAPMFLQMPIWVALYAMLYFAIELRQEPAFYGVFQLFGNWSFLADLSKPDRFIDFGGPIFGNDIWLLNKVTSFNLLPLLMGAIFYFQQKYLTPENPNLTPEQQTQQKIMKVMMVVMFPIFLYPAPSGLTLYIIVSSLIGTLESKYIRSHINAMDLEDRKPGSGTGRPGIMARLQAAAEQYAQAKAATRTGRAGARGGNAPFGNGVSGGGTLNRAGRSGGSGGGKGKPRPKRP